MDFSKYPKTRAFLELHPDWDLDKLLEWTEKELLRREKEKS